MQARVNEINTMTMVFRKHNQSIMDTTTKLASKVSVKFTRWSAKITACVQQQIALEKDLAKHISYWNRTFQQPKKPASAPFLVSAALLQDIHIATLNNQIYPAFQENLKTIIELDNQGKQFIELLQREIPTQAFFQNPKETRSPSSDSSTSEEKSRASVTICDESDDTDNENDTGSPKNKLK